MSIIHGFGTGFLFTLATPFGVLNRQQRLMIIIYSAIVCGLESGVYNYIILKTPYINTLAELSFICLGIGLMAGGTLSSFFTYRVVATKPLLSVALGFLIGLLLSQVSPYQTSILMYLMCFTGAFCSYLGWRAVGLFRFDRKYV